MSNVFCPPLPQFFHMTFCMQLTHENMLHEKKKNYPKTEWLKTTFILLQFMTLLVRNLGIAQLGNSSTLCNIDQGHFLGFSWGGLLWKSKMVYLQAQCLVRLDGRQGSADPPLQLVSGPLQGLPSRDSNYYMGTQHLKSLRQKLPVPWKVGAGKGIVSL